MTDEGAAYARFAEKNLENPAKIAYNMMLWVITQHIAAFGRRLNHAANK
jgi:hypothetical protein